MWPVNERTEMKLKIYLSEAWMCSEFGFSGPMSVTKGLSTLTSYKVTRMFVYLNYMTSRLLQLSKNLLLILFKCVFLLSKNTFKHLRAVPNYFFGVATDQRRKKRLVRSSANHSKKFSGRWNVNTAYSVMVEVHLQKVVAKLRYWCQSLQILHGAFFCPYTCQKKYRLNQRTTRPNGSTRSEDHTQMTKL